VEVSAGELVDRLTIARIKAERISDPGKLRQVQAELLALERSAQALPGSAELAGLETPLRGGQRAAVGRGGRHPGVRAGG
jgi:hypothetical protein